MADIFSGKPVETAIRLILTVNCGGYNYYMRHSICTQTQRGHHLEEHPCAETMSKFF
ncbi:MAG: hypothetical protein GX776_00760 [Oxalobacter sp.]|nr:hypothetical protein [Oxalobacter sp.]